MKEGCVGGIERRALLRGGGDIALDVDCAVDVALLVKVLICSLLASLLRLRRARRSASIAFRSSPRMPPIFAGGCLLLWFCVLSVSKDGWILSASRDWSCRESAIASLRSSSSSSSEESSTGLDLSSLSLSLVKSMILAMFAPNFILVQ